MIVKVNFSLIFFLIFLCQIPLAIFGQKFGDPKNINEAIVIMDRVIPKDLKNDIRESIELDTLFFILPTMYNTAYPVNIWLKNGHKSSLVKYYNSLGVNDPGNMEIIILKTYRNHLRKLPLNHEAFCKPLVQEESREREQEKIRFTTDTLGETYIPKDLNDCFRQINIFWTDSVKAEVKLWDERKFVGTMHHGFGTWIRNNWGLWKGSRLSRYFNEIGIYHPDDMSGIILTSYYRNLTGKEIRLEEQIKKYTDYWKELKKMETIKSN